MSEFRFRLYDADGDDLGTRTFAVPDWKPGDMVALRDRVCRFRGAIRAMPWHDLQALFALQFVDDITTVSTGETETVIRRRLRGLGAEGRSLLREALDEVDGRLAGVSHPRAS